MSIIFSDPQPARYCPDCYAIPCRCSRLTLALEWLIHRLEAIKQRRYNRRQAILRGTLALLLLAAPAQAQPLWVPVSAYSSAMAADWVSTARAGSTFVELNPIARPFTESGWPGNAIGAALDTTVLILLTHALHTHHPRILRWGLFAGAALRASFALHNLHVRTAYCAANPCPPPFH
jgi:hypothetical protein